MRCFALFNFSTKKKNKTNSVSVAQPRSMKGFKAKNKKKSDKRGGKEGGEFLLNCTPFSCLPSHLFKVKKAIHEAGFEVNGKKKKHTFFSSFPNGKPISKDNTIGDGFHYCSPSLFSQFPHPLSLPPPLPFPLPNQHYHISYPLLFSFTHSTLFFILCLDTALTLYSSRRRSLDCWWSVF